MEELPLTVDTSTNSVSGGERIEISVKDLNYLSPSSTSNGVEEDTPSGNESSRTPMDLVNRVTVFLPKVEPLKWKTFLVLVIFTIFPSAVYIVNFTKMGYGLTTFYYLSNKYEQYASTLGACLVLFLFILYLLDFLYWDSPHGKGFKYLSLGILLMGSMLCVLFMSGNHPYGPIAMFTIFTPLWLVLMKSLFYPRKEMRVYVRWLGSPFLFVSVIAFLFWLVWSFMKDDHEWNDIMKISDAEKSGCDPDFTTYPQCRKSTNSNEVCFTIDAENNSIKFADGCDTNCMDVFEKCSNSFIIWVGPLLVSVSLLFMSFFTTFLRSEVSSEAGIINFGKIWLLLLFAMWVTASLAGAGVGVSTALTAMTFSCFVASVGFMSTMYDHTERKAHVKNIWARVKDKVGDYLDVGRGLLIVTCAPLVFVYIFMSFLNQCIRRTNIFPCSKIPEQWQSRDDVDGDKGWVTEKTAKQVKEFRSWDRVKVFTFAIYWGIAFMTLNVAVAKFTTLFLSWLIETTKPMSLAAVTGILSSVSLIMFLLPPVPGLPIYLTVGIVVVAVGGESIGYIYSMLYAIALSLVLKLLACSLQQKLIGEFLKGYVGVRQAVGINSKFIRSTKVVLAEPGLSVAKVSILIGGPDWPTSVLCGIMGLNLIPILVGTIPVVFLIAPTILTGSFSYMAKMKNDDESPKFAWAKTVDTIFFAFTAIVQFGSMITAVFYLEKTTVDYATQLESMPFDEEVREAEEAAEDRRKAYTEVTQWCIVPIW
eukprot:CAMPEP_0197842018 /NCGR_PEP_ID=MMETSP1437-20131217/46504_1 /TAXON_ID=49252 ORGANISM="Eucampia antarctica, Strain CCMP1452" /NCGR_SAMPLE_ID=MMETSP1437 /ASSEMBLY_ACC=CAM_ASM_001096 /LENGTH=758 /DNA_ID=CAMNT_0043451845 /DNA_START=35 /DNA_END=2308 /DNA_ORIENTATION=-